MVNYLKMADKQRIQALLELGWSQRRIQHETGIDRQSLTRGRQSQVSRYCLAELHVTITHLVALSQMRRGFLHG